MRKLSDNHKILKKKGLRHGDYVGFKVDGVVCSYSLEGQLDFSRDEPIIHRHHSNGISFLPIGEKYGIGIDSINKS